MEEQMQSCTCINVCLFGATHIGCSHGCSHTVIPNMCVKTCKATFFGHSCPLGILLLGTSTLWCLKIHTQISTWFISGRKAFGLWAPNFQTYCDTLITIKVLQTSQQNSLSTRWRSPLVDPFIYLRSIEESILTTQIWQKVVNYHVDNVDKFE